MHMNDANSILTKALIRGESESCEWIGFVTSWRTIVHYDVRPSALV